MLKIKGLTIFKRLENECLSINPISITNLKSKGLNGSMINYSI